LLVLIVSQDREIQTASLHSIWNTCHAEIYIRT